MKWDTGIYEKMLLNSRKNQLLLPLFFDEVLSPPPHNSAHSKAEWGSHAYVSNKANQAK